MVAELRSDGAQDFPPPSVGDVVVLGVNARHRLGVVNGTTAVIQDLDLPGRDA
jgi:hypothetical protein